MSSAAKLFNLHVESRSPGAYPQVTSRVRSRSCLVKSRSKRDLNSLESDLGIFRLLLHARKYRVVISVPGKWAQFCHLLVSGAFNAVMARISQGPMWQTVHYARTVCY